MVQLDQYIMLQTVDGVYGDLPQNKHTGRERARSDRADIVTHWRLGFGTWGATFTQRKSLLHLELQKTRNSDKSMKVSRGSALSFVQAQRV